MKTVNPIKILGIDHIVLRTANLSAMLDFYTNVLGCPIERQLSEEVGLTQLRAGNALIDIVDVNSELGRIGGAAPAKDLTSGLQTGCNLDHLCLTLGDISEQALLAYLAAHGIDSTFEQRYGATGFGPSLYIKDPDGNAVELKPQSP